MKKYLVALGVAVFMLTGCLGMPDSISPVTGFDGKKFMGKWYEVARIENKFEKGLSEVTAEYTLDDSGKITVINRGYSTEDNQWKQAKGKAFFVDSDKEAYLKVSFFGPFYSSYVVFELGENYDYAFVSGADTNYLWLLSRSPEVSSDIQDNFMTLSAQRGFDLSEVVWVKHTLNSSSINQ